MQAMIEEVDGDDSDNEPEDETPRSVRIAQLIADHAAVARTPPADATVITDPYEAYLRMQATSADPAESGITVAAESSALRAILPVIDGQERVEAILDPGCQIVTMSEQVLTAVTGTGRDTRLRRCMEGWGLFAAAQSSILAALWRRDKRLRL